MGAVCLAILIFMPKVKMLAKIPPSLAAVAVGILMVKLMPIQVNTIGDLYTINSSLPSFHLPKLSLEVIQKALPNAFTIAILFIVAYNMCQWRPFVRLVKTAPKSDIAVLVITFMLTVVFDLVVAIEVGMVLACLLFMKRMSDETGVRNWSHTDEISDEVRDAERARMRDIPSSISVCEITGPLFFGAADQIGLIAVTEKTKCLILRMRGVPALDSTAMNSLTSLYEKCRKKKITLILSHVNDQPMRVIRKAGFDTLIGKENFSPNIDAAIEMAEKITSNR